jgi:hypothetical protein
MLNFDAQRRALLWQRALSEVSNQNGGTFGVGTGEDATLWSFCREQGKDLWLLPGPETAAGKNLETLGVKYFRRIPWSCLLAIWSGLVLPFLASSGALSL